jgi:3-methyladenine DNA glycosylase AlkD
MSCPERWIESLRAELQRCGDPERARGAQAYMKSAMPYYGVPAVPLRSLCRSLFRSLPLPDAGAWRDAVLEIFRGAQRREEWYVAVELCSDKRARSFQRIGALPMYEELIVTAAWWDVVDALATRRLGEILRADPRPMRRAMTEWSRGENLWKRRSAILCQLHFGAGTDTALLYRFIEPSLGSREFFLNKAIGWALRHYARTDPAEVRRYVAANRERLAPLSVREAMKHLGPLN